MRLKASRTKKAEKEGGRQAIGKRSRDNDEGLVVKALVGKRKALEEAHQSVMRTGPRLPPFNLLAPQKLPFGMEEVFAEGMERVDFGIKSDPEALARMQTSFFTKRAQKKILTSTYVGA
ncbi:unnamed protein product [Prunus armeniaca]